MNFTARGNIAFRRTLPLEMSEYAYSKMIDYIRKNPNCLIKVDAVLPESRKQRRWFEGALVPLFTFLQGADYSDPRVLEDAREDLKKEFWGEVRMNVFTKKKERRPKSSAGSEALNMLCERVLQYLTENYDIPQEALDPEKYKHWRDVELPRGGPEEYIDYLIEAGILTRPV